MDWKFMAKYIPLYQKAAVLTVELGTWIARKSDKRYKS